MIRADAEAASTDTSAETPARRMATPARADRVTVEELMRWAKEGRLRIPDFQRPLQWTAQDKRHLLDSMERGYPVGTLLLWKRVATGELEGVPLPGVDQTPSSGDVYLVVDGQQRIATLWEALGRTPIPGQPQMVFELPAEAFQLRPITSTEKEGLVANPKEPPALPLTVALDATSLSEWMPAGLDREVKRRYFDVGKRLREYPLPIYVVEGDDMGVLREVFDRINSAGRPLKREDVFHALVGSRIVRGDLRGLESVSADYEELGFGTLDASTIYKAFEAIRGDKVGKSDPHSMRPSESESDLRATGRALRETVRFLQSIGVPHVAVLAYELPLVVLARFFAKHPAPTERSLILLRRWFWRASIAERLGGASSALQQHVDDVGANEHEAVQALLHRTGEAPLIKPGEAAAGAFSAANARGKLVLCALFHASPRDLTTGDKLVPADVLQDGLERLLRPIAPPKVPVFGSTIANRLLGQPRGLKPATLIVDCDDAGALASHFISRKMQSALRKGDTTEFLSARLEKIERHVYDFFGTRTEIGRDDARPVAALASKRAAS